ncbi:MAG: hypothetical protein V3V00_05300 [Saprospiraceae bacterium]
MRDRENTMNRKTLVSGAIIILSILCFLCLSLDFYSNNLSTTQWDQSGDGLKNYFTFAYHYKYLSTFSFTGFLYPFGDLTTYTDSQYPFVRALQSLKYFNIDLSEHILLILNLAPIVSFLISGLLIQRILSFNNVDTKMQIVGAVFCIVLSPQILRIPSHFGLSYSIFFLTCWYLVLSIRADTKNLSIYPKLLFLSSILFLSGFIHAYHLVIISVFIIVFSFIYFRPNTVKAIQIIYSVLIAIISFYLFFQVIDSVIDRPKNPYGLWAYKTTFTDFLPGHGPFASLFNTRFIPERLSEGYCYPGFLPFLLLLLLLIKKLFPGQTLAGLSYKLSWFQKSTLWAGLFCLFIAMGVHLYFGDWLLELVSPLKQFRALGRFSWAAYYSIFIICIILISNWIQKIENPLARNLLFISICFGLCLDAYSYHKDFGKVIEKYKITDLLNNEKSITNLLKGHADPNDFQAMLPLPMSTEGAEKFNLKTNYFIKTRCLPFSYQTGMPMTIGIMSRVSKSSMFKILQLGNSIYGQKLLKLDHFPSTLPLLLVIHNEYKSDHFDILERAEFINSDDKICLYKISLKTILHQTPYPIDHSYIELSSKDFYVKNDTLIYFNDFDNENLEGMDHKIGCYFSEKGKNVVFEINIENHKDFDVELSFWNKILIDKSTVPVFKVKMYNENGVAFQDVFRDFDLNRVEVYDDWVRYKRPYKIEADIKRIVLEVNGKHQILDNVLLKSKNVNVVKHTLSNEALVNHLMVTF